MNPARCIIFLIACLARMAVAQSLTETQLAAVRFDQKLSAQVPLSLEFRDENGRAVALREYFGGKPVVLVLGYYECPMLCTLTFNGMVEAMNDMKWSIGKDFAVVHVSINPNETPDLAAKKKAAYVRRYGRPGAAEGWHFLTGNEGAIRQLAGAVGFHYAYDPSVRQYAHPSGLVIATPQGKISKYLFGVKFLPHEVYAGLRDAAADEVGSPINRLVLLCFHYNPIRGKYGAAIMSGVRGLAVATILAMGWAVASMIRRERRNRREGGPKDRPALEAEPPPIPDAERRT